MENNGRARPKQSAPHPGFERRDVQIHITHYFYVHSEHTE